ncbi:MAG: YlbF family regulator [Spirochaetes bacterium]|nr:YlbF family regulator [Spirochaetota bacterium]
MDEILGLAGELGRMIRETGPGRRFLLASERLRAEPGSRDLLENYSSLDAEMRRRREIGDIIEGFETEAYDEMASAVAKNELIIEFLVARREYCELLELIQGELSGE